MRTTENLTAEHLGGGERSPEEIRREIEFIHKNRLVYVAGVIDSIWNSLGEQKEKSSVGSWLNQVQGLSTQSPGTVITSADFQGKPYMDIDIYCRGLKVLKGINPNFRIETRFPKTSGCIHPLGNILNKLTSSVR